ncbi:MAG: OmpA family protein [Cognatishimia sp.]|uniref:OmpA family protein n=1 Tax=Cognatishimia sp. TaxID=2211648 RepID=UPI004059E1F6
MTLRTSLSSAGSKLSALRVPLNLAMIVAFVSAAILSAVAAYFSSLAVERASAAAVRDALDDKKMAWVEVYAEGLNVFLTGIAPQESDRFIALSVAGSVVDSARVIDNMDVQASVALAAPKFSIEILRNDSGVSLIGLVPEENNRQVILRRMRSLAGDDEKLSDFMEVAAHPVPTGWNQALGFAIEALEDLPRAKVSVESGAVTITAMAESPEDKIRLENRISSRTPAGVSLDISISSPLPVITPFTLRAKLEDDEFQFDSCSADTTAARDEILAAASAAGLSGEAECQIGLGVPTPRWSEAAKVSIAALKGLGGGSVTISDADISLVSAPNMDGARFDRVVAQAKKDLPDVFTLHATLPIIEDGETQIPEFSATLSPEGLVQLRGKLGTDLSRTTIRSYAQARFGSDSIYDATRLAEALPIGWANRVMAGLDALSELHNGAMNVTPDLIEISGQSGRQDAGTRVSQVLALKLGDGAQFDLRVTYNEALNPLASLPTPAECIADIQATQADGKIVFEPGKGALDSSAGPILDQIAEILKACSGIRLQIQGHTDSQGRESMNQALSQNRAQSVLAALRERRVLTGNFEAVGYGESQPIADNETEEGREANRRIEFVLLAEEEVSEAEVATDAEGSDTAETEEEETENVEN